MTQTKWFKIGLTILLVVIISLGYGGLCKKDKDTSAGSSVNTALIAPVITATVLSATYDDDFGRAIITGDDGTVITCNGTPGKKAYVVQIVWVNISDNVTQFEIWRRCTQGVDRTSGFIDSTPSGITKGETAYWFDQYSFPGGIYYYRIYPWNPDGLGPNSNEIVITIPP